MISATGLKELRELGLDIHQVIGVVAIFDRESETLLRRFETISETVGETVGETMMRRFETLNSANLRKERNYRFRSNRLSETVGETVDETLKERGSPPLPSSPLGSPLSDSPPLYPPNHLSPSLQEKRACEEAITEEFKEFWKEYPNKVGKAYAAKAYKTALRRAEQDMIMKGLKAYVENKPPEREWCNPSTWLHQDRWTDQPASPSAKAVRYAGQSGSTTKWKTTPESLAAFAEFSRKKVEADKPHPNPLSAEKVAAMLSEIRKTKWQPSNES